MYQLSAIASLIQNDIKFCFLKKYKWCIHFNIIIILIIKIKDVFSYSEASTDSEHIYGGMLTKNNKVTEKTGVCVKYALKCVSFSSIWSLDANN